jgi:hypothetical protein
MTLRATVVYYLSGGLTMTETTNEDLFAKTFDIYFEKYGKLLEQIYPTFSSDNGFEEPNQTVGFLSAYKEARITPPFKAETPLLTWLEMPFHDATRANQFADGFLVDFDNRLAMIIESKRIKGLREVEAIKDDWNRAKEETTIRDCVKNLTKLDGIDFFYRVALTDFWLNKKKEKAAGRDRFEKFRKDSPFDSSVGGVIHALSSETPIVFNHLPAPADIAEKWEYQLVLTYQDISDPFKSVKNSVLEERKKSVSESENQPKNKKAPKPFGEGMIQLLKNRIAEKPSIPGGDVLVYLGDDAKYEYGYFSTSRLKKCFGEKGLYFGIKKEGAVRAWDYSGQRDAQDAKWHDEFPELFCSPKDKGSYNQIIEDKVGTSDQMNHFLDVDLPKIVQVFCQKQS